MAGGGKQAHRQLPLPVRLADDATVDNFCEVPSRRPAVAALYGSARSEEAPVQPMLFFHGPAGSGKSHLLQALCQLGEISARRSERGAVANALYLPLQELRTYSPADVLDSLEAVEQLCLDDVHSILGDSEWEMALFNLINRFRSEQEQSQSGQLVLAATAAPRTAAVALPDLRSRLSWASVFHLPRYADEEKLQILVHRAKRRGMQLDKAVATYIVNRAPRAMEQLIALLERLDEASLIHQRRLSIPFVRSTLGW